MLCRLLRECRERAGLREIEVAARLNEPQTFVSNYESGGRRLDSNASMRCLSERTTQLYNAEKQQYAHPGNLGYKSQANSCPFHLPFRHDLIIALALMQPLSLERGRPGRDHAMSTLNSAREPRRRCGRPNRRVGTHAATALAALVALFTSTLFGVAPMRATADASTGSGGLYTPLQPEQRILDTRASSSIGGYSTPMQSNTWRTVQVDGRGAIPASGVAAVALSFTVLDNPASGYLKADKDESTPNTAVSYMVWVGGQQQSNSGVLAVGDDGKIQVMASSSTDLAIDIQGYYTAGAPAAGGFVPVAQTRIVDTRNGTGVSQGQLTSGSTTTIHVGGLANVPVNASAVMVNFLIANQSGAGRINPYPADAATRPSTSLNFGADGNDAISAPVQLSSSTATPSSSINIYVAGSSVDLAIDVIGYFTAAQGGAAFTPASTRVIDTRYNGNTPLAGGEARAIQIAGVGGVPVNGISAAALDIIIFDNSGTANGWIHAWPDNTTEPNPSAGIEYRSGGQASNLYTVQLGSDGAILLHNMGSDAVDFAVDVEGWYSVPAMEIQANTLCATPTEGSCVTGDFTSTATPTLTATTTSPDGGTITYNFQVWTSDGQNSTGSVPVASGTVSSVASGSEADFTTPALTDEANYQYSVQAQSGTVAGAWSPWFVFIVDTSGVADTAPTVMPMPDSVDNAGNVTSQSSQTVQPASPTDQSGSTDSAGSNAFVDQEPADNQTSSGYTTDSSSSVQYLPVSGSSNPNGSQMDPTTNFSLKTDQSDVCLKDNGSVGGQAHANERLYLNLFRKVYDPSGWATDERIYYYFGLDKKNHYSCWHNVSWGYYSSTFDVNVHYVYAVGWWMAQGPYTGPIHVNYRISV